jgi:hypothetical protein
MDSGIKKLLIVVVLVLILIPVVPRLLPKPLTFERFQEAFLDAGLNVEQFRPVTPSLEAVEQVSAVINGAQVEIYRYDNEGKIVRYLEYQKKDPGAAMVESWGLAQSLGAAVPQELPSRSARKRMYMIVATGPDQAVLIAIVTAFTKA